MPPQERALTISVFVIGAIAFSSIYGNIGQFVTDSCASQPPPDLPTISRNLAALLRPARHRLVRLATSPRSPSNLP